MLLRRPLDNRDEGRKPGLADFGANELETLAGVESVGTGKDDLRDGFVEGGGVGRDNGVDAVRLAGKRPAFKAAGAVAGLDEERR